MQTHLEDYKYSYKHCLWMEDMRYVRQYGQRKAMKEQGWTTEDFVREFGKNYLEE